VNPTLRHALAVLRQGRRPAVRVYESIGSDFFLAPAPGWLNLGLWEGPGEEAEAERAPRRLVERLAADLPTEGTILDVANGLGAQDLVIAEVARPRRLVALNLTEMQLRAGAERLRAAGAHRVVADAVRLPVAGGSADGVICVEAAFHFRSRLAFLREARRALRPGGVITLSDITTERWPRTPAEVFAAAVNLRAWGLRTNAAVDRRRLVGLLAAAGFADVRAEAVGERVFDPAFRLFRDRLERASDVPGSVRAGARLVLSQMEVLWRRRLVEYVLVRGTAA